MTFTRRVLAGAAALALLVAGAVALVGAAHWALGYLSAPSASEAGPAEPVDPSASTLALERDLVAAVAKVKPAVVSINVSQSVVVPGFRHPFADDPFFQEFFGRRFRFEVPDRRFERHGVGSGVVISSDGYILTNWHVLQNADTIQVRLADGRLFDGRVVGSDPSTDVAVVKVEASDLPAAPLGRSDGVEVGTFVFAVGTPFDPTLAQTVTFGIVSATGRARGIEEIEDFIQTDAAINPGNSGGPLSNLRGEVIGLNTAIVPDAGRTFAGVGFAIPIDLARRVADDIREFGEFRRGFLGIQMRPVRDGEYRDLGLDRPRGVVVEEVVAGSPAAAAGLRAGDVVVRFAGEEVLHPKHLQALVVRQRPGARVEAEIRRGGERRTVTVEIGKYDSAALGDSRLGLRVEPLTNEIRSRLGITQEGGVQIVEVEPGSPAARAGIEAGDVVLQANRKPVASAADLAAALRGADSALLLLWDHRTGRTGWLDVPLE